MILQLIKGRYTYDVPQQGEVLKCEIINENTLSTYPLVITDIDTLRDMFSSRCAVSSEVFGIPMIGAFFKEDDCDQVSLYPTPDEDYILYCQFAKPWDKHPPFATNANEAGLEFMTRIGTIRNLEEGAAVLDVLKMIEGFIHQQLDKISKWKNYHEY